MKSFGSKPDMARDARGRPIEVPIADVVDSDMGLFLTQSVQVVSVIQRENSNTHQ